MSTTSVYDISPIAELERLLRRQQEALDREREEFEKAEATWKAAREFAAATIPDLEAAIRTLREAS
jgi:hypothetical protein